jgi:hypothetical protein
VIKFQRAFAPSAIKELDVWAAEGAVTVVREELNKKGHQHEMECEEKEGKTVVVSRLTGNFPGSQLICDISSNWKERRLRRWRLCRRAQKTALDSQSKFSYFFAH